MKNDENIVDLNFPSLPISIVAETLNVHVRTLRIYDKEGILKPKRSNLNRRLYTLNDVERGRFIILLTRNLALNIVGVKIILKLLDDMKIDPQNYQKYMKKVAKEIGINEELQKINIEKSSKKGKRISEKAIAERKYYLSSASKIPSA